MNDEVVVGLFELLVEQTLASELEVEDVSDADVDDTEEALVALLELLLVKDLDGDDGRIGDVDVEAVVPVGVQGLFDDRGGVGLLSVDGDDGERIRETKDIALGQAVGGDDSDADFSGKTAGTSRVDHGGRCRSSGGGG